MSEEIIKVLDNLAEKFGIAVDWTSQNVLPYLQELCDKYVNYEIWTSVVYVVICLLVVILMVYCIKKLIDIDDTGFFTCFLGIIILVSASIAISQVIDIVTALTFPEKLIYEYISSHISQ